MSMESFDNTVKGYLSFLDNEYVSGGLSLLLILYASSIAPKLPVSISKYMDNTLVRGIVFFLIVYLSKKQPSVALIVSVAVLVTLMTLSAKKEGMDDLIGGDAHQKSGHQFAEYETDPHLGREYFASVTKEEEEKIIAEVKNSEEPVKSVPALIGEEGQAPKEAVLNELGFSEESLLALQEKVKQDEIKGSDVSGFSDEKEYAAL